jgi:hypothetical protein
MLYLLSVHLVVSGTPPNPLFIYGAFLDEALAQETVKGVNEVSGLPCRVLSVPLADARLNVLLDELARHEEKTLRSFTPGRFEAIDRVKLNLSDYILNQRKAYTNVKTETEK